jgi:hypothetical protein
MATSLAVPSILDAIVAASLAPSVGSLPTCAHCRREILPGEAFDRSPLGPTVHNGCLPVVALAPPTPVIAAPTLEAKRELALARFLERRAETASPKPPAGADKAYHCPICRTGSQNRQGIVSHLRQIHGLSKAARDSAMAAAGI